MAHRVVSKKVEFFPILVMSGTNHLAQRLNLLPTNVLYTRHNMKQQVVNPSLSAYSQFCSFWLLVIPYPE